MVFFWEFSLYIVVKGIKYDWLEPPWISGVTCQRNITCFTISMTNLGSIIICDRNHAHSPFTIMYFV